MQGQVGKGTSDFINDMVSKADKSFSGLNRSQKDDQRGGCGSCTVCSAPCSSCVNVDKLFLKTNDGEACTENRQCEQISEISITVAGSFSEHSIGNGSPNACDVFASNDNVVHLKHGVSETRDDSLSCASETDKLEDSLIKYNKKCKSYIDSHRQESLICSKRDRKDDKPLYKLCHNPTKNVTSVLNREGENGAVCGEICLSSTNSIKKSEDMVVEIPPTDEAEESGLMELDVKICDICGDAGKEYLLASCSRCSDGAEHTYCMRVKLDKVPKGEWLCEGCNSLVEKDIVGFGKPQKLNYNEKANISNKASSEQARGSEFVGNRAKDEIKCTGKRRRDDTDDAEVSSVVQKPDTMQTVCSPETINLITRSRSFPDISSLKNQDKGKLKSFHLASSKSAKSDADLRTRGFQGTLSKSMSFNSLASKPVDQVVVQGQKSAKEQAFFRPKKDGFPLDKSMSFKSAISTHSAESKTKMLSPRFSHIKDNMKIKDRRISIERNRSSRSEQPLANSTVGNSKDATSRIEIPAAPCKPVAIINQREQKYESADSKLVAMPRSSSFVDRKRIISSSSLGECKRPSSVSTIGRNNIGQKSGLKEDISSLPVAERPHTVAKDGERVKEHLGSRFQPASIRSSGYEFNKPGLHRKHKMHQTDDGSRAGADVASHQARISLSTGTRSYSVMAHPEETKSAHTMAAYSLKHSDMIDSPFANSNGSVSGEDGVKLLPSFRDDELDNVSTARPSFVNSAVIPEREHIWKGSFEINQGGRCFELWDGIQAHFSTGASPMVVHAVKKFERRITLQEVPRLTAWPIQFRERGAKKDDIALFFFAKDLESYNNNYKILVENMMTNDLALKGNVDGAELLIFHSSQLPDNMKRWNMFFYIWGVFRGKGTCAVNNNSLNQSNASQDIPPKNRDNYVEQGGLRSSGCGPAAVQDMRSYTGWKKDRSSHTTIKSVAATNDAAAAASEGGEVSGNIRQSFFFNEDQFEHCM